MLFKHGVMLGSIFGMSLLSYPLSISPTLPLRKPSLSLYVLTMPLR